MSADEPQITEEIIGAYVDGELEPAQCLHLEAQLRADPELERRIARARALRARLEQGFAPALDEPVPQRLLAVLKPRVQAAGAPPAGAASEAAKVVALPLAQRRAPRWVGYALAASVLLGVGVGFFVARDGASPIALGAHGGWIAAGELDRALTQRLSSEPGGSGVRVGLSFIDHEGNYCRAFALGERSEGLACRAGGAWRIELLDRSTATGEAFTYRTASTAVSPTLLAAIEARIAGDPLDARAESAARSTGWSASSSARP